MAQELRRIEDIDQFDREWETYLTGKPYRFYGYLSYRRYKRFFLYKAKKSVKAEAAKNLAEINERADKVVSYCQARGIAVERKTEQDHFDSFDVDPARRVIPYRNQSVRVICDFEMPAEQSRSLLHSICDRARQETIMRLTEGSPNAPAKKLSDKKDVAKNAVAMILDDVKQLLKKQPGTREYSIPIMVTAYDFRYKEPSGDVVGLVFEQEGLSPIIDKKERDLLCAAILEELHGRLQKYKRVFDTYVGPSCELEGIGSKANMLVMFEEPS